MEVIVGAMLFIYDDAVVLVTAPPTTTRFSRPYMNYQYQSYGSSINRFRGRGGARGGRGGSSGYGERSGRGGAVTSTTASS